jgi:imidazolonepropionase-like amidohydrolase
MSKLTVACFLAVALAAPVRGNAATESFVVLVSGNRVGHLTAVTEGARTTIDYDVKSNGRGPTIKEAITIGAAGVPTAWTISGATTFGSKVDERFSLSGTRAEWVDAAGKGSTPVTGSSLYVPQSGSPWALGIFARALLKTSTLSLPALPAGTLRIARGEVVTAQGTAGPKRVTAYAISGTDLSPDYFLLDDEEALFGYITPTLVVLRDGYEGEATRFTALAKRMEAERFVAIHKQVAHRYGAPVRVRNVRLFDPRTKALTNPVSVVMSGRTIAEIAPLDSPASPGEVTIDGAGGTLVPGMYEMHAHLGADGALLNVAAGITSVRDMGNDNATLDELIARIEDGTVDGPRVTRSGFIEGKSQFNANTGIIVDSEEKAIDAVRWYGARGYWQIKIYNSMNPAWVPAIVREAHRLGMRVAGHVPAFSTADAMIAAGYDEMTHINQFMLGWVLKPGEDTRTLLRLTAMRRFPEVDLTSEPVQRTIQSMVDRKVAIDPTLAIHEELTNNRDGVVPPGAVDYLDHMPIGYQRSAKKARADAAEPADDRAYRVSFDTILATVKMLHDRGVFIVPGTDLGGSFTYHRELELYQRAGMTAPEILARATLDVARYMGQDQHLGSIEKGKLADFFLIPGDPTRDLKAIKTIRMVVKDGVVYFPSEIYPNFGIRPFVEPPVVIEAAPARQ